MKVTSYYYGGSKSPLYVDVYRTPVVSTEHGFVTVTTNGCVPVAQANYGGNEQCTFNLLKGENLRHDHLCFKRK